MTHRENNVSEFGKDNKDKSVTTDTSVVDSCICNNTVCTCTQLDQYKEEPENNSNLANSLLDSIVDNVPNMIFLKRNSDLSFEFMNRAGEELLGVDREDIMGKNDYDFFSKDRADFFTQKDREVMALKGVVDIPEESIETPQGIRILRTQKIALRDEKGAPQYLLGISEDITERRKTEQKLRAQAMIIDQIHDSVISTDLDGLIISWNKGAERLLGYTSDGMLGKHISMLYLEEDHSFLENVLIRELKVEGSHEAEVRMLRKSGDVFFAQLSLSMLYDEDGNAVGMIGFAIDITERKLMEDELESYSHVLETQVEERTAELVTARDAAEKANNAKSEFLSHMSHELRTPLNAILGFGQILKLDTEESNIAQHENIDEILEASNHLMGLINEVLDLAKVEAGAIKVSMEYVPVTRLIKQCFPLIASQANERQLEIIDNVSDKNYTVQADFGRLKQVLINIFSNAVKYNSENGCITLDAEIVPDTSDKNEGKDCLRLCVSDTGNGLTQEKINALFTPFDRLGVTDSVEGTGIGLVITRQLMELMGGCIGVESVPGEGCTFWIELILVSSHDA